ncbi:MAG: SDR family oxidoreductase [Verrucomicrobia bacterium]|nr:SDR family oxidoreductase [Verrucomicrobiota bacterium]
MFSRILSIISLLYSLNGFANQLAYQQDNALIKEIIAKDHPCISNVIDNRIYANVKKVVLITGASRGIGLATAHFLANKNYCVYATARNVEGLDAGESENLHFEKLDVTDDQTIQNTIGKIIEKEGRLDIVINNAGYALAGPLECLSMDEIQDQMNVNFFGAIRVCQAALPHMRKQQSGHIINISSEQGTYGLPYGSMYTSSKAALESLSEALSIELLPWNIHVSIVEPGMVATRFSVILGSREAEQNPYAKICEKITNSLTEERTPSPSCQTPEEIAQFIHTVITTPRPQLRYQTSKAATDLVSRFLKDPSGQEYLDWIQPLISEHYSEPD